MKHVEMKRIWRAWILLSVFVPMLLGASLHVHTGQQAGNMPCVECLHHVHHAPHITSQSHGMAECLLCQFLALPFLAVSTAVVAVFLTARHVAPPAVESSMLLRPRLVPSGRAPPTEPLFPAFC